MLARASHFKHTCLLTNMPPWVPSIWIEVWVSRYVRPYSETRQPIRPEDPPFQGGGNVVSFTPDGVIDRSITLVAQ